MKYQDRLLPNPDRGDGDQRWYDNDSLELFTRNLKVQGSDWEYRNKNITYKLNSARYRTAEFDKIPWDQTVVMFGTSNMFGVGVSLNDTVPALFTKITRIPAINLGVPGASAQYILYNAAIFRRIYPKPKAIVFDMPDASRCSLFLPEGSDGFIPVHCGSWVEDISGLGKAWRRFDMNQIMHMRFIRTCLKQMWDDVPYLDYSVFPSNQRVIPECQYVKQIDNARDIKHPGSKTNKAIAEYIASRLNL